MQDQYKSTALITFSTKAIGTHLLSTPSMAGGPLSLSVLYVSIFQLFNNLICIFFFFVRYDLELHMVHLARDPNVTNKIAVVGLFYKIGHHDDFLSKVQILSHKKIFNYFFFSFVYTTRCTRHSMLEKEIKKKNKKVILN